MDNEARQQIRVLQAQVATLEKALNEANDKLGLPRIQIPKAPRTF